MAFYVSPEHTSNWIRCFSFFLFQSKLSCHQNLLFGIVNFKDYFKNIIQCWLKSSKIQIKIMRNSRSCQNIKYQSENSAVQIMTVSSFHIINQIQMQKSEESSEKSFELQQCGSKKLLKLQLAETTFECECGKNFLSFPSIYSHCKIKHGLKISSKAKSGSFKRYLRGNQHKILYSLQQNEKCQGSSEEYLGEVYGKVFTNKRRAFKVINKMGRLTTEDGNENVYGAIKRYLKNYIERCSYDDASKVSDILLILTECMNSYYMIFDQKKPQENYCRDSQANTIPLFFNFLLVWYLPTKGNKLDGKKIDLSNINELIVDFSSWLNKEGLSEYQVSLKDSESTEDQRPVQLKIQTV